MERELKILELADYYEKFEVGNSSAYLIINKKLEDYPCMFGFVNLSENLTDAKKLFCNLENRAKELGYQKIVGPMNYCSWMSYRWTTDNYDLKLFPDCNNPPYYNDIVKQLGYSPLYTYRSAVIDMNNPLYAMGEAIYKKKLDEGFSFRFYHGEEALSLAEEVFAISKDAFRDAYLYSDIPDEYFTKIYMSWIKQVDVAIYVAYYKNKPVGYAMGYANPYSNHFISKTTAVKKAFQKNKLYVALLYLGYDYVSKMGYSDIIYHFQCEQKDMFRRFDSTVESNEKRYAVYKKELL
ncbi:MAG: hypothetical protein E7413_03305 [Ruminococcaceae bacterium]|nr:hypothetical protein [Oscillospiraceae bacterium]